MPKDLRTFLQELEQANEMLRVPRPVDPGTQMGSLLAQSTEKALLFESVTGHPGWRVAGQLLATRRQIAIALGDTDPSQVVKEIATRMDKGFTPTETVSSGPVQEIVLKGDQVDITRIPFHYACLQEVGPYLGSGMCIVKDPETGLRNVSYQRMQIKGPRKTGFLMVTGRHIWRIMRKYEQMKEPLPVAVAIGHHPLLDVSAVYSGHFGDDEYAMAGTLLGEPVQMVKCQTIEAEAPACAEVVLEGLVYPDEREHEGPYGEFHGYCTTSGMAHVFHVTAITMRENPIYRTLQNFEEGNTLCTLPMAVQTFRRVRDVESFIDLKDVNVLPGTFTFVLQMTPQFRGQAKNALLGALASPYINAKIAIAVDEDVDVMNMNDVMWAITTRVNPADDVFIVNGTRGHTMDAPLPEIGEPGTNHWQRLGSKMGIDATKPPLSEPDKRKFYQRTIPTGTGEVRLEDFLKA